MAGDRYGAQTFTLDGKGHLREGRTYPCKSADEALEIASTRVRQGYAAGSVVFLKRGGGEFDAGESITISTYGAVPCGMADELPF